MNFEILSLQHFLIFTIRSTLILQVCGDGRSACETLDESVAFPQKNQFSADSNWRRKNIMTGTKQKYILINQTLGDCVQLDLENRTSNIYIDEVIWKKAQILIGKMKRQNISFCAKNIERCHVFKNGSLSLCPTLMEDIGHYTAEIFTKDGENLYSQTVQLVLSQPKPELEPEPKRKTNSSHLLFFILTGVHVAIFLIVLVSSGYHLGKRKRQPDNGSPVLHRPQAVETTEEGQLSLIRSQEETTAVAAAAAGSGIECPVSLNISTFQDNNSSQSENFFDLRLKEDSYIVEDEFLQ